MANKSTAIKLTLKMTSFILRLLLNIIFYILVVILIINFSKTAFEFAYQLYGPNTVDPVGSGHPIIFPIEKGEKTMDIASKLELYDAIENKYAFALKTKFENQVIMPGTYNISTDMTYDEILAVITDYSASIIKDEETNNQGTPTDETTETEAATNTNTDTGTDAGTGANTDAGTGNNTDAGTDTNTDSSTGTD